MRFAEAVNTALNRYATFTGRARRPEYWYFALFALLVVTTTAALDATLFPENLAGPITTLAGLLLLLPSLAVATRRLHDLDRSGWWMLVGLLPLVGWIILLVWLGGPGTPGANRFGAESLASRFAGLPQAPG